MKKAALLSILVVVVLLAVGVIAYAQQPTKVPRIGFLTLNSSSTFSAGDEAFRQGLISVGYIEGKNIVIEWRYAEGNFDRLREMAAELLRLKVNAIVTGGP
jgi:putative tryptophan/tyrosine transport system substrate-binding protein